MSIYFIRILSQFIKKGYQETLFIILVLNLDPK